MADEPDSALTGAAFELANAGFKPMSDTEQSDDKETIGSDSASLRDAAERRSRPSDEIVLRKYVDVNGEPVAADEAITSTYFLKTISSEGRERRSAADRKSVV